MTSKRLKWAALLVLVGVFVALYVWMLRPFTDIAWNAENEAYFKVKAIEIAGGRAIQHGAGADVDTIPELLAYYDSHPELELDANYRAMLADGEYYEQANLDYRLESKKAGSVVGWVRIHGNPKMDIPSWTVKITTDGYVWTRTDVPSTD